MATEHSSSNTAMVVIFALLLLAGLVFFFLYQGGYVIQKDKGLDIKVQTPSITYPAK